MDWQAHFAAALVFAAIGAFFLFVTPIPFLGWPALLGSVSQLMSAIRVFRKLPSEQPAPCRVYHRPGAKDTATD